MKQHITTEQLESLSGKQMLALRKWSNAEEGTLPPLLSIGQMIEFLDEKRQFTTVEDGQPVFSNKWNAICQLGQIDFENTKDLRDALWSACKEVLNAKDR